MLLVKEVFAYTSVTELDLVPEAKGTAGLDGMSFGSRNEYFIN